MFYRSLHLNIIFRVIKMYVFQMSHHYFIGLIWSIVFVGVQSSTGFYVDNENAQSVPLAVNGYSFLKIE